MGCEWGWDRQNRRNLPKLKIETNLTTEGTEKKTKKIFPAIFAHLTDLSIQVELRSFDFAQDFACGLETPANGRKLLWASVSALSLLEWIRQSQHSSRKQVRSVVR